MQFSKTLLDAQNPAAKLKEAQLQQLRLGSFSIGSSQLVQKNPELLSCCVTLWKWPKAEVPMSVTDGCDWGVAQMSGMIWATSLAMCWVASFC